MDTSGVDLRNISNGNYLARFIRGGAVELYHNESNKLQTKADGVNITGELECDTLDVDGDVDFDGGQVTYSASGNHLKFVDGAKTIFGTGSAMSIEHNGTNSIIKNITGHLKTNANTFHVNNAADNETMATFTTNAGVDLFFDNAKKLDTEAYGVDITGTLQSDTLIVTGVSTVASLIFSAGTNTNGVSYFDANGQVQSTVSPASGISTSNSILTTNASGVPIWTDTIDCGTF